MFAFLTALLPFLKELWHGEGDLSKSFKRNKVSATLFILNVLLAVLLIFMTEQTLNKQVEKNEKDEKIDELTKELDELKLKRPVQKPQQPTIQVVPTKTVRPKQSPPEPEPDILDKLEAIRNREED